MMLHSQIEGCKAYWELDGFTAICGLRDRVIRVQLNVYYQVHLNITCSYLIVIQYN